MPQTMTAPDGSKHTFPDGTSPDVMRKAIFNYGQSQSGAAQGRATAASDPWTSIKANAPAGVEAFGAGLVGNPLAALLSPVQTARTLGSAGAEALQHPSEILPALQQGASDPAILGRAMGGATQGVALAALPQLLKMGAANVGSGLAKAGNAADFVSKMQNPTYASAAKGLRYLGGKLTPATAATPEIAAPGAVQGAEMYRSSYGTPEVAPRVPQSTEINYRMGGSPVSSAAEPSINGLQPQTPMQSWRAANPNGEGRMTGQFTEGAGGLNDLAANKIAPTQLPPSLKAIETPDSVMRQNMVTQAQPWTDLTAETLQQPNASVAPLANPHPWFSGVPNGIDIQALEPGSPDALADAGLPDFKKSPQGLRASTARLNNNYLDALNDPNK